MKKTAKKTSVFYKETEVFYKGLPVLYVPHHANWDLNHPDCRRGVVSSVNEKYVFVKYDNAVCQMVTGDEPYTAQATDPALLVYR